MVKEKLADKARQRKRERGLQYTLALSFSGRREQSEGPSFSIHTKYPVFSLKLLLSQSTRSSSVFQWMKGETKDGGMDGWMKEGMGVGQKEGCLGGS